MNARRIIFHLLSCAYAYLVFSNRYSLNSTFDTSTKQNAIASTQIWNLSYAPYDVECPGHDLVRKANDTICAKEEEYIRKRNIKTEAQLKSLLYKNEIPNFDIEAFWNSKSSSTIIAIAISGGGYRSMLSGGGILTALDAREVNNLTHVSGILQASSYIAGISGGAWLVMSQFVNDWPRISKVARSGVATGWNLKQSLLEGMPDVNGNIRKQNKDAKPSKRKTKQGLGLLKLFGRSRKGMPLANWATLWFDKKNSTGTQLTPSLKEKGALEYLKFYKELLVEVRDKRRAGFVVGLTDYWGRALAHKLFTATARTPGVTMTAVVENSAVFKENDEPFPIIGAIAKDPMDNAISSNDPLQKISSLHSSIFEITPFEFGSWDSSVDAFVEIEYLGSYFENGSSCAAANATATTTNATCLCKSGFDNVGFLTGTSSSLFNHIFKYIFNYFTENQSDMMTSIESILKFFGISKTANEYDDPMGIQIQSHPDHAVYSPNPFWKFGKTGRFSKSRELYLVDGGDDGQNLPFQALIRKGRKVDLILAYDMSGEDLNYPNGSVLQQTSLRFKHVDGVRVTSPSQLVPFCKVPNEATLSGEKEVPFRPIIKSIFPKAPTTDELIEQGLNLRPIFLGCDIIEDFETIELNDMKKSNGSGGSGGAVIYEDYLPPIIMYQANSNYTHHQSNFSTFKLRYNESEIEAIMENGFQMASFYNSSLYAVCLNCLILKREFDRIRFGLSTSGGASSGDDFGDVATVPKFCQTCYKIYCWRG
ncbi:SPO1 [Candida theae]|uniref:Lysophospholipase n=1 Tax=Candida theae TaxID=1198502 RepID=A0AAD5BGN4_9ASCO|nr:SPO1 [Candida theae]KAI5961707.1 SPO1 [Candida theae]